MIGNFRQRLTLLSRQRLDDEAGGAQIVYSPAGSLWGAVRLLSSTRDIAGNRTVRLRRIGISTRYRADITPGDRIEYAGSQYEIVSTETEDGRERLIDLVGEEVRS